MADDDDGTNDLVDMPTSLPISASRGWNVKLRNKNKSTYMFHKRWSNAATTLHVQVENFCLPELSILSIDTVVLFLTYQAWPLILYAKPKISHVVYIRPTVYNF